MATLAVVLRREGLAPDPFAPEAPEDQLRQALRQPDLPSLGPSPGPPPYDSAVARATLHYLAEQNEPFRTAIQQITARGGVLAEGSTRDAGLFTLGALVLLAMHAAVELRKEPRKGWYFHFKVKLLPDAAISKVLRLLYTKPAMRPSTAIGQESGRRCPRISF
jgi:hypothetical protein